MDFEPMQTDQAPDHFAILLRWVKRLLSLAIFLGVLGYLVYRAYPGVVNLLTSGAQFHFEYAVFSVMCWVVGTFVAAVVWHDMLRGTGAVTSLWFDLQVFLASSVARKIPGTLWYALGRLAAYQAIGIPRRPVLLSLVIEMAMHSASAVGVLIFSAALGMPLPAWLDRNLLFFVVFPVVMGGVGLLGPRLIGVAVRFRRQPGMDLSAEGLQISGWDTLRWFGLEAFVIVCGAGVAFGILLAFDPHTPAQFSQVLGAYSLAIALGPVAMWLPGDIGLRDGFLYLALQSTAGGSIAALTALAFRLLVSALEIGFGLLAVANLSRQLDLGKINLFTGATRRSGPKGPGRGVS
jgi:hypothetical protein